MDKVHGRSMCIHHLGRFGSDAIRLWSRHVHDTLILSCSLP
jgi:hypothetical protein